MVLRTVQSWSDGNLSPEPSDQDITKRIVRHYRETMPSLDTVSGFDLGRTLNALKTNRDKRVAHSEAIGALELPKTTWDDAHKLLQWVKDFIATIGWAYLSVAYTDDSGNYLLGSYVFSEMCGGWFRSVRTENEGGRDRARPSM